MADQQELVGCPTSDTVGDRFAASAVLSHNIAGRSYGNPLSGLAIHPRRSLKSLLSLSEGEAK
jgi:hypothetical protein